MTRTNFCCGFLAALLLLSAAGCGAGSARTYPVSGKVLFREDGKPLRGGVVLFELAADPRVRASGDVEPDGSFSLGGGTGPGAVAGDYRVLVQPPVPEGGERGGRLIDPRYERFDSSGLRFTVKSGDNFCELRVSRPAR